MVSLTKGTVIGFLMALVALVIGGAAAGLLHLPVSSTAAALTGMALLVMVRKRPTVAVPVAVSVWFVLTPIALFGAQWALNPLATGPAHLRCGTGDIAIPFVAAVVLVILGGCTLAWTLIATGIIRRAPRVAFVFAGAAMLVGTVSAGAALSAMRRPAPDAYLDLFERMTLEPGGALTLAGSSFVYEAHAKHEAQDCVVYATLPDGSKREIRVDAYDGCPRLHVHHDGESGFFLLTDFEEDSQVRSIINAQSEPDQLVLMDFPGRLGVPRGWAWGNLLGVLMGTLALASAIATMRRARRLVGVAREGEHTGGGWLALSGSPPRFVRELEDVPPGPVLVHDHESRLPTYRDDGKPRAFSVTVGGRDAVLAAARARAVGWACVAATIVLTASVPVWVAGMRGLL